MHSLLMAGDFALPVTYLQGRESVGEDDGQHHVPAEAGAGDSSHPEPLRGIKSGQITFLGLLNISFLF